VCLQEVTRSTAPLWRAALGGHHVETTEPADGRRLAVLTAARGPVERLEPVAGLPWPERVLRVRLADGVEVVNVHSPISQSPGRVKVVTHEAVHAALAGHPGPAVLCGDLNTPRREHADGTVTTFGKDPRHDAAERLLVRGLGWTDAFRAVHGYAEREPSWVWPHGGGWRLDHVLCRGLAVRACAYVHAVRDHGLSDHSALLAELG
jgi:endonuclease/exonuclease/phosphatase (EEP) superfamily protein YafD